MQEAHDSADKQSSSRAARHTPERGSRTPEPRSVDVQEDLSVLYTNARSLIFKRDELLAYIEVARPDVIAITETWATSDHLMTEFSVQGYEGSHTNMLHKNGGVICYVKSDYPAVITSKQDSEKYDTVYIEVATSKHNKLTIGTVYRPPKQQAADEAALYEEIQDITQNKQSVITGDFNCPNIDWTTMKGDQEGSSRLFEMLEDAFLTQIITQMTRDNNLLDLVLVSDSYLRRKCQVGQKVIGCDHYFIRLTIRRDHELTENISKIPYYRRANLAHELLT